MADRALEGREQNANCTFHPSKASADFSSIFKIPFGQMIGFVMTLLVCLTSWLLNDAGWQSSGVPWLLSMASLQGLG